MIKVSVVVPIYNVASYIERCVRSLMEQTLREVEYIFVDDASPDNSIDILRAVIDAYPTRKSQIHILSHIHNCGLPAARNTGMRIAKGEYIYHCDSDDYTHKNLLLSLYHTAKREHADFVWCDYYTHESENIQCHKQQDFSSQIDALKGTLQGKIIYNVWNKLIKKELYTSSQIIFPSGYSMGEDMTMLLLLAQAKKVAYVPYPLYYYVRSNTNALTRQTLNISHTQALQFNLERVSNYLHECYQDLYNEAIAAFQLQVKWQLLVEGTYDKYKLWKNWFPESHTYIWKYHHTQTNLRIKLIEWCAAKGFYFIVWLHHQLVIRFYTQRIKNL